MPMPPAAPIEGAEVIADEVLERRQRRSFSAQFKRRILEQAAACENHGEIAALLRKHGLYSSHLTQWRAAFDEGGRAALVARAIATDQRPRRQPATAGALDLADTAGQQHLAAAKVDGLRGGRG